MIRWIVDADIPVIVCHKVTDTHLDATRTVAYDASPVNPDQEVCVVEVEERMPEGTTIRIPPINVREVEIRVEELTPLIVHRFSEKARKQIADKQAKKARGALPAKDSDAEFENSLYIVPGMERDPIDTPGRYYLPGVCFKKAAVSGCRVLGRKDLPMTKARTAFFVVGDPVIEFDSVSKREDHVRNDGGGVDLRYRAQFDGWAANLLVTYHADALSLEELIELFLHGGFSCGVGEWRPSSSSGGEFGRFKVTGAVSR